MFLWRDRSHVGSAGLKPGATNIVAPTGSTFRQIRAASVR